MQSVSGCKPAKMRSLLRFLFASSAFGVFVIPPYTSANSHDPAICSTYPTDANPRRIAGRAATPDSRPWIVLAWISCKDEGGDNLRTCEGSLIRTDWVLTAACCFSCGSAASVVVDIGLHNSDIRAEVRRNRSVERVGVDGIFIPADYEYPSAKNDIALLHLTKPVKNATRVIPLVDCSRDSVSNVERSRVGRVGVSSGWGKTASESSLDPKPLQDAHVAVWSPDECDHMLEGGAGGGMVCAGSREHTVANVTQSEGTMHYNHDIDPCFVEKGSPLVLSEPKLVDDDSGAGLVCEWQLLGVLSFGLHCEEEGVEEAPGFYTNVCDHRQWIDKTIMEEEARLESIRRCPTLPQPPLNGYLCTPFSSSPAQGMVQFCCDKGYALSGVSMATCNQDTGQWEPQAPDCLPVECPPLSPPTHGLTTPPNCSPLSYQMGCWFSCQEGYQLAGSRLLTCGEEGKWSHAPPNCQVMSCGPPPFAGNLQVSYSSSDVNATAVYSCKGCFKMADGEGVMNGTLKRHCGAGGQWTGPLPVCEVVKCPLLSPPLNGSLLPSSSSLCGARVRFACDTGFNLIGAQETECMESGKWSHPAPTCRHISCPPPQVTNSNMKDTNTSYSFGAVVKVECEWCRVMVEGEGVLTCNANGEWDKPLPKCQWATCPLPGLIEHGQIAPLGQLYFCGTTVRFRCRRGYRLVGPKRCTCQANGTWSDSFPNCQL